MTNNFANNYVVLTDLHKLPDDLGFYFFVHRNGAVLNIGYARLREFLAYKCSMTRLLVRLYGLDNLRLYYFVYSCNTLEATDMIRKASQKLNPVIPS